MKTIMAALLFVSSTVAMAQDLKSGITATQIEIGGKASLVRPGDYNLSIGFPKLEGNKMVIEYAISGDSEIKKIEVENAQDLSVTTEGLVIKSATRVNGRLMDKNAPALVIKK